MSLALVAVPVVIASVAVCVTVSAAAHGRGVPHPERLRTVPVAGEVSGRIVSRRAHLFVPTPASAAAVPVGREIRSLRTVTSDTFAARSGVLSTRIYPLPINYRDTLGRLVPIDDTLIADGRGGYRNKANSFHVDVPASLTARPVRFSAGRAWLAFSLRGGRGDGRVSGDSERFGHALPGVAVAYTASATGLKEQLTLRGHSVPKTLSYLLRTSPGLVPRRIKGGLTGFVDSAQRAVFVLGPELMWSSRRSEMREAVATSLRAVRGGWRLTLKPDRSFVSRVLRSGGAVVIDPSVFPGSVKTPQWTGDCELNAASPATANCGNTVDSVDNNGGDVDHIIWQYDVAANVPRNAEVLSAELAANVASNANTTSQQVGLYQVTQSWTQGATWNTYDGSHAWATAGGDTASIPADTTSIAPTTTAAAWHPLSLVQGWVDGTIPNDGLMLEAMGSPLQSDLSLYSNSSSNGSNAPSLNIRYEPRLGDYRGYTLDSQTLTDRSRLGINVADGDLLVSNQDLHVSGTAGDDLMVNRYYNNLDPSQGAFGRGWTMTPGADTALAIASNGLSVFYRGESGVVKTFAWNGSSWTAPAGLDAVLTQTGSSTWTLHFNGSGTTENFSGPGGGNTDALLTSVVDRNGNTTSYSYNSSNQLQAITDTQGHQTSLQYNGAGYVAQMTDAGGRTYKYAQDANGNLTSYVDPAGNSTAYAYDTHGDLTQITTAAGTVTKVAYANAGSGDYRVTSVTRLVKPTDATGPTRSYGYYTGGSPCTSSDEGRTVKTNEPGYQTTYCYNASDQVTRAVDADGHTTMSSYSADANIAQLTNPLGGTAVMSYRDPGTTSERLSSMQEGGSSGPTATLAYNDPNNQYSPSQVTDPENRSATYAYDGPGNEHTAADQLPSQNQLTIDHNADGTIADSIDANGNKTTYHYTGGNLTEIDPPDLAHVGKTTITYDALSRPTKIIDGKSQERDITYDVFDRPTNVTYKDATGVVVATINYTYDNDGNLTKRSNGPAGGFSLVGRVASVRGTAGGTTATLTVGTSGVQAGDAVILAVHTSNATGAPSATDSAGNTYRVDKGPILDGGGDATTILSAQNVRALSSGQHITVTMPSNSEYFADAEEFSGLGGATDGSNSGGAKNSSSVSSGTITTSTAGDLLVGAIGWESGATPSSLSGATWTANSALSNGTDGLQDYYASASATGSFKLAATETGNFPTWMAGIVAYKPAGGTSPATTYTYDGLRRLTSETLPDTSTHSYGYDAASNLTSLTDAGGTVSYGYNKENWLTSVADPSGTSNLTYDSDGNRTALTYPNGASISYTYDTADTGRLTKITDTYLTSGGGQASKSYTYTYTDPGGRDTMLRQTMTDQAGNQTIYTYDALNRLIEALTTNGSTTVSDYRYTLDGNGNLLQENGPSGTTSYAYNADNQACWSYAGASTAGCANAPTGAYTASYDLNGNLTSNGNGLTLAYNALDQTTSANGATTTYDGENETELTSVGNTTIQNDFLGLSRTSTTGDTIYLTRDLTGQIIDQRGSSSGIYYPLIDGEDTIVGLTNSAGQLANTYTYDPNGSRTSQTGTAPNNWGFQSGYLATATLYHFGARYYNSGQVSWTQEDALNRLDDLQQLDPYTFASDNPINASDPTGTTTCPQWRAYCNRYAATLAAMECHQAVGNSWVLSTLGRVAYLICYGPRYWHHYRECMSCIRGCGGE